MTLIAQLFGLLILASIVVLLLTIAWAVASRRMEEQEDRQAEVQRREGPDRRGPIS